MTFNAIFNRCFFLRFWMAMLVLLGGMVNAQGADVPKGWTKSGHADKTADAFRHWDTSVDQTVPSTCSKCHTATGLPLILKENLVIYPNSPTRSLSDFVL